MYPLPHSSRPAAQRAAASLPVAATNTNASASSRHVVNAKGSRHTL